MLFLSVCVGIHFTKTPWLLTNLKKKIGQIVLQSSAAKSSSPKRKHFPAKNKKASRRGRRN